MQSHEAPGAMALVVAEAQDGVFYRLINNNRTKLSTGSVKLAQLPETQSYFINIEKFSQNIIPGTPFVLLTLGKGTTILFPHIDQGLNGIFIPKGPSDEYFYLALKNAAQLIPFEEAMAIQQFKDSINMHCRDIQDNPLDNDNPYVRYISKGGGYFKDGFSWLGGAVASGINKSGEYITSKMSKGEEVQVSDTTKSKLQTVKSTVSTSLTATANILNQIYQPVAEKTRELTNELSKKIDESDNKVLKQGKQITAATWNAAGTAISGVGEGISAVGQSLGTTTLQIVEKKYGQDVSKTITGQNDQETQQNLGMELQLATGQDQEEQKEQDLLLTDNTEQEQQHQASHYSKLQDQPQD